MKTGTCDHCGYELGGLPAGAERCPECGERLGKSRPGPTKWQSRLFALALAVGVCSGATLGCFRTVELWARVIMVPVPVAVLGACWFVSEPLWRRTQRVAIEIGIASLGVVLLSFVAGMVLGP